MSVITQGGKCVLMEAAYWGETEIVVELVKAGAKLNLQNTVCQYLISLVHDVQSDILICTCTLEPVHNYSCVILSIRKGTQQ